MSFGRRVKEARKRAELSQEALARRAGMSLPGVAKIEQGGVTDPHYSTLQKLAEALDVDPLWLVTGEEVGEPVLLGKAEAPTDTGRAGEEQREDLGGAYRPRYWEPQSNSAETVEVDLEALYGPWEEYVNDRVVRWKKKLADGDFDRGEVKEGWAALKELTRKLSKLNAREKEALPPQSFHYGFPAARTGRAMYRINDLSKLLAVAARSKYGEDEPPEQRQDRAEVEALLGKIAG
jgi:transcriptional regulator with XRE-family HTH domain